jgi:hypothetical protein
MVKNTEFSSRRSEGDNKRKKSEKADSTEACDSTSPPSYKLRKGGRLIHGTKQ